MFARMPIALLLHSFVRDGFAHDGFARRCAELTPCVLKRANFLAPEVLCVCRYVIRSAFSNLHYF